MLRTIRRAVTLVAAGAAVTLAVAGGAGAAEFNPRLLQQMESATLVNLSDITEATLSLETGGTSGDFTCANPVVAAAPVTPAAYLYVGETYGLDAAEAVAHCMSYQGGSAAATLTVWLEYQPYYGAAFQKIPGCSTASVTSPAVVGAHAIATPTLTCQYRADHPAAGRPHRAHATLVHSGAPTRVYHGYSQVYADSYAVQATTTSD